MAIDFSPGPQGVGGGVLPSNSSNRLMGICLWMGSHFQGWIDYNRVTFSLELLRMGLHIFGIWGIRKFR